MDSLKNLSRRQVLKGKVTARQQSVNKIAPWSFEVSITDECLAKNGIYCQSCRDECESNAIEFSYLVSAKVTAIPQPSINQNNCTQCGACVSSCPQQAIIYSADPVTKREF